MKKIAVFAAALLAAACGFWFWTASGEIVADKAVVEGQVVLAGPAVSGVVAEVYVAAGDVVAAGQPLFAVDASGYEAQLARERAKLAEIAASLPGGVRVVAPVSGRSAQPGKTLAALKAEEEEARKAVATAAHVHAAASVALSRASSGPQGEYAGPGARRQAALIARDEAAIMLRDAREAFDQASYARAKKEAEETSAAANGIVSAALAARIAEYQAQISRVNVAERNLASTVVIAPEGGKVAVQAAARGVVLTSGDTPVVIVPEKSPGIWVTALFPEQEGANLAKGQECVITLQDSGKTLSGSVGAVLPVSGPEKGVAARVIPDQNDAPAILAVGRPVSVTVFTRGKLELPGLGRKGKTEN